MGIVKPFMISSDKWKALLVSDTDWTRPTIKTSFQPPTISLFPPPQAFSLGKEKREKTLGTRFTFVSNAAQRCSSCFNSPVSRFVVAAE